jgi:hypothetical protein
MRKIVEEVILSRIEGTSTMKSRILRLISTSMLVPGLCAVTGCFGPGPYYGGGPGYAPGYAYAPEYVNPAPYRYGPAYYPPVSHPEGGYYVPGRGAVHYYNGGEHAWEHPVAREGGEDRGHR